MISALKKTIRLILQLIMWMIAFCYEGFSAWVFFSVYSMSLPFSKIYTALLFHIGASIIVTSISLLYLKHKEKREGYYFRLYGMLVFFIPFAGLPGVFLSHLFMGNVLKSKGLVEEYNEITRLTSQDKDQDDEVDTDEDLSDEVRIEPVLDILAGKDASLKNGAVKTLGRLATPEAIGILKKCLKDSDADVRFYAHSTIGKLEKKHNAKIKKAIENTKKNGVKQAQLKQLADTYINYIESGLPSEDTKSHYAGLAVKVLKKLKELYPKDSDSLIKLGRLSLLSRKHKEAEEYYRDALVLSESKTEPLLGLGELFYENWNFRGLGRVAQEMKNIDPEYEKDFMKKTQVEFWSGRYVERSL